MTDLLHLDPFEHMRARTARPGTPFCEVPLDVAVAAFARDRDTCRYCGWVPTNRVSGRLALHHRDHDHGNHALDNLATACIHCHGVHHAGFWAARGQAKLVLLPEVPQAQLSVLARAMAVARHAEPYHSGYNEQKAVLRDMRDGAEEIASGFERRSAEAERLLGTADPGVLHTCLGLVPTELDLTERLSRYRIWLTPDALDEDGAREIGLTRHRVAVWLHGGGPYAWLRENPGRAA